MNHEEIKLSGAENSELSDQLIGQVFGVYQITREIGRGGMGVVYMAERIDGVFRQDVAIKFIKRGMDTDSILKRFRNERQILASLSHPNVALLYDGGTTEQGLPYFVMEYVAGEPLYQFCDSRKLSIKERLKIFIKVCEAVHATHQIKVVHRDLKPSNILVKPDGTPKLLDFGIAKLLDSELADTTIDPTATQMRMMTPEYASPEQVSGGEISTASDIYSLGVLLYELLSGHRPYRLKNRSPYEIARVICEEFPESLGESLESQETFVEKSEVQTLEKVLESRGSNLKELRQALSGELEQIVMNALHKKPENRYQTALELAEDIQLYLKGKPLKRRFIPQAKPALAEKEEKISLAVLPLKVIGSAFDGETDEQYLSIGLADALITRLSQVGRLVVRPTSSTLRFSNQNDAFEVGRELEVEFVVDGNIRFVGNRIRVTAQLLNVKDNSTCWAEKFDEQFTDVLELEDSISERVVKVLLPHLTGEEQQRLEKRGTNNVEAYQAYLRGRYFANQFSGESLLKSVEAYHQAIKLDPNYALPHVGIADFYIWSAVFGQIPCHEAYPKAKAAVENALRFDDSLGEAYAILAFITLLYEWNWSEAEKLVKRALELNPNYPFAHECYSNFFSTQGLFDEAIREIKLAEELDPLSPRAKLMTSWTLYQARRFAESVAKAKEATEMQTFAQGFLHLGNAQANNGETKEAVESLRQSINLWMDNPMPRYMLCYALVADNQKEEAWKVLEEMKVLGERVYLKPFYLGMAYAALAENDLAFEWFEKSLASGDEWFIWFGVDPKLDGLRQDSRYLRLLQKTNNPILAQQSKAETIQLTTAEREKTIAVLPFKLLITRNYGDSKEEYLSIGLTDALITRLSNVQRLIVRPTTSVLQFQTPDANPFFAGQSLKVEYLIDGTIRRIGEMIRITVQLLKVSEETTLWAKNFDEKFTDVLAFEDSISEQVTKALIPQLTTAEQSKLSRRETDDPNAYEAHLRGRYYWNQFTPESLPKALKAFETAVSLDPNYALAYVDLADFYNWANIYGLIPARQAIVEAEKNARKAIELDETLGEAYASLSLIMQNRKQWDEAEKIKKTALKFAPNYHHAYEWSAAQLVGSGKTEEGLRDILIAEQLDPLSRRTKTLVSWTFYQAHRFEEALKRGREIIELDANYPQGYAQIGLGFYGMKLFNEALPYFEKFDQMILNSALTKYQLCFALVKANKRDKAKKVLEEINLLAAQNYVKPYFLAMANTALGNYEQAFSYFGQSLDEDCPWMLWFKTEPMLEDLRKESRFQDLLLRMNYP